MKHNLKHQNACRNCIHSSLFWRSNIGWVNLQSDCKFQNESTSVTDICDKWTGDKK